MSKSKEQEKEKPREYNVNPFVVRPAAPQKIKRVSKKTEVTVIPKKPRVPRLIDPRIVELEDKLEIEHSSRMLNMTIALLACFILILFGIANIASIKSNDYYEGEIDKYCATMNYGPMYKDNGVLYCSGTSERERSQSVLESVATMADAMYGAEEALKYDVRQYTFDKSRCAANVSLSVSKSNKLITVRC